MLVARSVEGEVLMRIARFAALLAAVALPLSSAQADEGMWTFDGLG
jgi:hypothetical protein